MLFCCLCSCCVSARRQDGYTNVLTASNGMECIQQLLLLRELERERERLLQLGVPVPPTDDAEELMRLVMMPVASPSTTSAQRK